MRRGSKVAISTAVAAVLSGVYWFLFFLFAAAATASDYRAGSAPGEGALRMKVVAVAIAGPLLFALCIAVWRWLEAGLIGSARDDR